MGRITYVEKAGQSIGVYLNKQLVGHIYQRKDGYVYAPKGSTLRGQTYQTVAEVKKNIEASSV